MLSHVWSSAVLGVDALPIEIETHIEPNIPKWTVVGLPDGAVREVPMFGGLSIMLDDSMVVSVGRDGSLLVRVDPGRSAELLARPHQGGLLEALSTNRGNGIAAMARKIRDVAQSCAAVA